MRMRSVGGSPRVRAVLFDATDTLFRVRGSVGATYANLAARFGARVDSAHVEDRFRAAFPTMPPLAFTPAAAEDLPALEYAWWRTLVARVFADLAFDDFDGFFAELFAHFARGEAWELFPETCNALAALRDRGLRLGVVSNFDGRLLQVCEQLGIDTRVDTIVMSSRVGHAKPDPRIFAVALERLGVEAATALHVGDSEREDIRGAQAAGVRAVLIRRSADLAPTGDVIADLRQLLRLIT
jgi:putative hydrolase of the HAD superfamily